VRAELVVKLCLYDAYFADGFAAAHEEARANASSFKVLRREPAVIRDQVSTWMKNQGAGYRDFEKWVDASNHQSMWSSTFPLPALSSPFRRRTG
jgi:hypothetical protein